MNREEFVTCLRDNANGIADAIFGTKMQQLEIEELRPRLDDIIDHELNQLAHQDKTLLDTLMVAEYNCTGISPILGEITKEWRWFENVEHRRDGESLEHLVRRAIATAWMRLLNMKDGACIVCLQPRLFTVSRLTHYSVTVDFYGVWA